MKIYSMKNRQKGKAENFIGMEQRIKLTIPEDHMPKKNTF
jgi:hypothetical protein